MENLDHILIFKTNIDCTSEAQKLHAVFDNNPYIESWSIDLEDVDCVLRVVSPTLSHQQIIALINRHGFSCCELI